MSQAYADSSIATKGIVASNSTQFVASAIDCLNAGECFVVLRSALDKERIDLIRPSSIVEPQEASSGWINQPRYVSRDTEDTGQILFTSGTEGEPKPILISHRALAFTTRRIVEKMAMDDSVREYVGVPVYHSFGFGRCRATLLAGGAAYVPANGFDPLEFSQMLADDEVNALSLVPSLCRLVLQHSDIFDVCGQRLRWLEIGSQYMSAEEKMAIMNVFPNATIVQHYGLTEASRTTLLAFRDTPPDRLESVGRLDGQIDISISDDHRIRIRGPNVANAIVRSGEICPMTDGEGWLLTNDLGHIESGYLYFDGRADDQINVGGVKVSPEYFENRLHASLACSDLVYVARVVDQLRGNTILVTYGGKTQLQELRQAAESTLSEYGIDSKNALQYFQCDNPPLTDTGKVKRSELVELFQSEKPIADAKSLVPAELDRNTESQKKQLVALWEEVLQISPVSETDSFFDLGGDSLSAISVAIRMEKLGIPRDVSREIFQGRSIAEIVERSASATGKNPLAAGNQAIDAVRGLLALFVVASHWMPGVVERLPAFAAQLNSVFSPLYSAGTPGFAMIFGVGVGYAYMPRYRRSAKSLRSLTIRNAMLLATGILSMAILIIASKLVSDQEMSAVDYSNAFYGVLTYYFLAVLSIPLWLSWLVRRRNVFASCIALALLSYVVHQLVDAWGPGPSSNPLIQTGVLLLTAKFNYFELSAGVLLGLAFGVWIRRILSEDENIKQLITVGGLLMLAGFLLSIDFGHLDLWFTWPKPIYYWTWVFYLGAMTCAIRGVYALSIQNSPGRLAEFLLRVFSIIGVIAFPIFIGHEMVIPLKDLLLALNSPSPLAIALLCFFLSMTYLIWRLYRVYYSGKHALDS